LNHHGETKFLLKYGSFSNTSLKMIPGSVVGITKRGPNPVRSKNKALEIIQILTDHGWLQKVDDGMNIDGQHHPHVWRVIA
jgi:hypothetical protein